jgi:hypothetical protein
MTSVLVVNAGSSSLKLRVLGPADEVTAAGWRSTCTRTG